MPSRNSVSGIMYLAACAALDQARAQPPVGAQAALQPRHPAAVGRVVVIVTQQVEKAVERQDLQLVGIGMPGFARLPAGDAGRR